MTYGTAAAPFLATRTLHQLALDERKQFPIAADIIINDFYVDDVITGADTLEELNAIKQQLVSLLALGGFNLHKWSSNCEKLLKTIPKPLHETLKCHGLSYAEAIKTLSLYWQPKSDQLLLNISTLNQHPSFTKKTVLSDISKLFDPLGFAAPVVINGKMFMQSLWQHKIAWKDTLNDQLKEQWLMLRKDLPTLNDMAFNRCCLVKGSTKIQLLGFADASEKAFGACVYIRSQNNDNQVEVQLLTSKSRVAPLLTESIPRLELCAALLLSQLIEKVITAIKIPFDGIILWSDSTIALSWMLTEPYKLKTFIAIRVYKIQHIKSNHNIVWKHVSSSDNPADLVSRGMSSIQYATCQLWWHGPSYLLQNEDMWPEKAIVHNTTTLPELKAETIAMVISTDVKEDFILITKYSNYQKMINITAFILRFIQNCRTDKLKRTQSLVCREILSTDELRRSKMKLVSLVQTTTFKADIKSLQKHGELPNNSIIKYLSGPYNIKQKYQRKDTQMKAYIVNFVCFVTKGTHLEIVLDLTAESFIQALKRFISRRLHPNSVWSDNATNFHGAYNIIMAQQQSVLNEKDHNHIMNLCATQNLEWKFIPARSPHFGGLWESSVKSFKSHFKKVINDTALTYEEMLTLINQIEAILNSRPITPMSNNPNDPLPLTPAHLMMGGPITALDEKLLINIPYNLINWQKITQMVQSFWTRYQKEYLHTLQQRKKWKTPTDNISIGDIVLLHEDNVPTNKWPIGCVINVFPGTDGNVRAAEVRILKEDNNSIKTKDNIFQYKTFTRAITKICKLSISED